MHEVAGTVTVQVLVGLKAGRRLVVITSTRYEVASPTVEEAAGDNGVIET